ALAIYGYFSSFAGGGDSAFPSRKKILYDLKIGKEKYYNHYNLLLKEGYITTERERYYHEQKKKYVLGNNI
ncbi:helix-turn-helix domain-containing protein, partial [Streptococcus suis]